MTISIIGIESVSLSASAHVISSDIKETSQNVKFVLINNMNQTLYLTKGPFTDIINESGWFEVTGSPITKTADQKYSVDIPTGDSTELTMDSKLIQDRYQATEIGQNIAKNYFYKKIAYDVTIFGNPFIQIGDVVSFIYNYGKININTPDKRYLVVSVNHNFSQGLSTTIKIRPLEI